MMLSEADVLRIYTAVIDGDGETAGVMLSEHLDGITSPLRAKDGEERCGATYDPWGEGDVMSLNRCTLRKGHETETTIHADYGEGEFCEMWWRGTAHAAPQEG